MNCVRRKIINDQIVILVAIAAVSGVISTFGLASIAWKLNKDCDCTSSNNEK